MSAKPPTNLEYALLGLLHGQPLSGYDLRKVFATTAMGNYSSSPGAIYPALKRLETRGLIDGEIDDAREMRPRKVFAPSDEGKAVFRDWLQEDVEAEDVERRLEVLMLRLAFHWILDDLEASRTFVANLAEHFERNVESLVAQRQIFPEQAPIQPRLALDFGIAETRAAVRWAHKALKQLETQAR
jgi:DNA-binding PadR family transcriptional regulator